MARTAVVLAIPGDAGLQIANADAGVAAGKHFQHPVEVFAAQFGVRRGALQQAVQIVNRPLFARGQRDDELSEQIERVAGELQRLDIARIDGARQCRRLQEVVRVGRVKRPHAGFTHPVPCAAERCSAADTEPGD